MKNNKLFVAAVILLALIGFLFFSQGFKRQQAQQDSALPALKSADLIKDHSPSIGPTEAPVQIVEFLDPECEACRAMDPIVKGLLKDYEGRVRFVVRYMPFHQNSMLAAVSLEEARDQGKYWEALSTLFYYQPQWGDHHDPKPELISKYLVDLGVKAESLKKEVLLKKHQWKVDLDYQDGKSLGVNATPTFFINGRKLDQIGYGPLKAAIDQALTQ